MESLIVKFTYETRLIIRRVANLAHFICHVIVNFHVLVKQFESIAVDDVLIFCIVIVFNEYRFHRIHWIEEIRERYY